MTIIAIIVLTTSVKSTSGASPQEEVQENLKEFCMKRNEVLVKLKKANRVYALKVVRNVERFTREFIFDESHQKADNNVLWYRTDVGKRPNLIEIRLTGLQVTTEMRERWAEDMGIHLVSLTGSCSFSERSSIYILYKNLRDEYKDING
jgi:hypothetical protein